MQTGHNTYLWTPERVHFMADAAVYGDFPAVLARAVADCVPQRGCICDAGCGTGWLSLALLPYFPSVTAADASETALSALRAHAAPGLQILQTDLFTYCPPRPFDAMVFCFFGSMEQTMALARRQCCGRVVLIKRSHAARSFSADGAPHRNTSGSAEAYLAACGIPYQHRAMTVEMGQPLRTEADAIRFVRAYSAAPDAVCPENVLARLRPIADHPVFRFYLPRRRELGLFWFDVPHDGV